MATVLVEAQVLAFLVVDFEADQVTEVTVMGDVAANVVVGTELL